MNPFLRRGGAISLGFHAALLLALVLSLPTTPPLPAPAETAVTMTFQGPPEPVQRGKEPAAEPSPAPAAEPSPPADGAEKPKPAPEEAPPPPPPPPPPPAPPAPAPPLPTPPVPPPPAPAPAPPKPQAPPPAPPPPAPPASVPAELATPLPLPPPVPPPPAPKPAPAPKPVPTAAQPALPKETPPAPPAPKPAPASNSAISQPNPTKNAVDDSKSLENTLERLRASRQQNVPPRATYNPPKGGAAGGGNPAGVENASLSAAARGAIGDRIRECWTGDKGALDFDKQVATLEITTDAEGVVRDAQILHTAPTPVGRAFAERARRAAMEARCAALPLPPSMKGQTHKFEITFRP